MTRLIMKIKLGKPMSQPPDNIHKNPDHSSSVEFERLADELLERKELELRLEGLEQETKILCEQILKRHGS